MKTACLTNAFLHVVQSAGASEEIGRKESAQRGVHSVPSHQRMQRRFVKSEILRSPVRYRQWGR